MAQRKSVKEAVSLLSARTDPISARPPAASDEVAGSRPRVRVD